MTTHDAIAAYLALGSNLNDPASMVVSGIEALEAEPDLTVFVRSALYLSPPLGPPGQPDYVNAVVGVSTGLAAHDLLAVCQAVEHRHGRVREGARWGPRTLDIDVLLYGDRRIESDALYVPHPAMTERAFVMIPLAEIAGHVRIPGHGKVGEIAAEFPEGAVRRLP